MSITNHPNVHVIDLMFKFNDAIRQCLRGEGLQLEEMQVMELARELAEKAEEVIDSKV